MYFLFNSVLFYAIFKLEVLKFTKYFFKLIAELNSKASYLNKVIRNYFLFYGLVEDHNDDKGQWYANLRNMF